MSAIDYSLRLEEVRAESKEEVFKTDAIAKIAYCLLCGENMISLIEELHTDFWDLFNNDLEDADINLYITEAVAFNIRNAK